MLNIEYTEYWVVNRHAMPISEILPKNPRHMGVRIQGTTITQAKQIHLHLLPFLLLARSEYVYPRHQPSITFLENVQNIPHVTKYFYLSTYVRILRRRDQIGTKYL